MFSKLTAFAAFTLGLSRIVAVLAVPTVDVRGSNVVHKRSTPSPPYWVAYDDDASSGGPPPAADTLAGYNVFILAFLLLEGPWDNAEVWQGLSATERESVLTDYHSNGISLIVTAFGSTDVPTSGGADPTATANTMAAWVLEYGLDGIDVDYEDMAAMEDEPAGGPEWLITFTTVLRQSLPQGQYILTHAPVAPWFSPNLYPNNAYLSVNSAVGNLIDWYNVQFYNQNSDYTTCAGLLTESSTTFPGSALFQIAASGVSLNKLVIGKPAATGDETNGGYMDPATLATCVQQAQSQGWSAGVMAWQYPDASASWIATVRADSWPVGSGPVSSIAPPSSVSTTAPPTTQATSTTTSFAVTTTGSAVTCGDAAAWSASLAYPEGSMVSYEGALYTAVEWNEDEVPEGPSGAWQQTGTCSSLASVASKISLSAAQAAAKASITKA